MANQTDPVTGLEILTKQPWENILFDMQLSDRMRSGDTITSVDSVSFTNMGQIAGSTDIALGSPVHDSGTLAQVRIDAGQDGENYRVTFRVLTTGGDSIEGDGMLYVRDL